MVKNVADDQPRVVRIRNIWWCSESKRVAAKRTGDWIIGICAEKLMGETREAEYVAAT